MYKKSIKFKTSTDAVELINAIEEEKKIKYPVNLRAIVSTREAGSIIGKAGCAIQTISENYNVSIKLSPEKTGNRRLVHVTGLYQYSANAWVALLKRIMDIVRKDEHYNCHKNYGIDFVLPDGFILYLIQEDVLDMIAKTSCTKIHVKSDYLPRSTERIIRISIQNKENIHHFERAVQLLFEQLSIHARLALSFPGNSFYIYSEEDDHDLYSICSNSREDEIIYNYCI
ncbi:uncharacterized protein BX663DRAFT_555313 [Cokeromyces recurvatus]|uniref:uncharacterized protein n=1 Tax=Cokeromyces recurvatus TaxID=90255 RepID=UPI00221F90C3|nr:uncharacterized protein BX663DRAFT_555313 [Cokeromyces recurvatus]KAI7898982.1 hypothetical protein BX663DRAFT_555313 [Cokeromyces recurvatus]